MSLCGWAARSGRPRLLQPVQPLGTCLQLLCSLGLALLAEDLGQPWLSGPACVSWPLPALQRASKSRMERLCWWRSATCRPAGQAAAELAACSLAIRSAMGSLARSIAAQALQAEHGQHPRPAESLARSGIRSSSAHALAAMRSAAVLAVALLLATAASARVLQQASTEDLLSDLQGFVSAAVRLAGCLGPSACVRGRLTPRCRRAGPCAGQRPGGRARRNQALLHRPPGRPGPGPHRHRLHPGRLWLQAAGGRGQGRQGPQPRPDRRQDQAAAGVGRRACLLAAACWARPPPHATVRARRLFVATGVF